MLCNVCQGTLNLKGKKIINNMPSNHYQPPAQRYRLSLGYLTQAHSPEGAEDVLPGMCALAQQWLEDVGAASFRGSPTTCTLERWFQEPRVKRHLQVGHPTPCQRLTSKHCAEQATGLRGAVDGRNPATKCMPFKLNCAV